MSDTAADLGDIIINDASQVVLDVDQTVADIMGDGKSMIHVVDNTKLNINGNLTAHAHIDEGSAVHFIATPTVEIVSTLSVIGTLNLITPDTQSIVLADKASVTINSTSMTSIRCKTLEIQQNTQLVIINQNTFYMETTRITVDGTLLTKELNISNIISHFAVGSNAQVEFDPVTSNMYLGAYIDIRGRVALKKHVSIVYPCSQFLLEAGTLTWPATSDIITIECSIVKINAVFSPGIVSFGAGIDQFTVGSSGKFTFIADGPFLANTVSIAGNMQVKNIATFQSLNSPDHRILEFVIHNPGGVLELNSDIAAQIDTIKTNQQCNILHVKSLTVDNTFIAGEFDFDTGADDVTVNRYGHWIFSPCDTFHIERLVIRGTTTVIKDHVAIAAMNIDIQAGGRFSADSVSSNGPGTGNSIGSGGK